MNINTLPHYGSSNNTSSNGVLRSVQASINLNSDKK